MVHSLSAKHRACMHILQTHSLRPSSCTCSRCKSDLPCWYGVAAVRLNVRQHHHTDKICYKCQHHLSFCLLQGWCSTQCMLAGFVPWLLRPVMFPYLRAKVTYRLYTQVCCDSVTEGLHKELRYGSSAVSTHVTIQEAQCLLLHVSVMYACTHVSSASKCLWQHTCVQALACV